MRSISGIIRDVLDNTDCESIVTFAQVDRLHAELSLALAREGYIVDDMPELPDASLNPAQLHGTAHLLMTSGRPGADVRTAEIAIEGTIYLAPVVRETSLNGSYIERYNVWLEGHTTPLVEGERAHLVLRTKEASGR